MRAVTVAGGQRTVVLRLRVLMPGRPVLAGKVRRPPPPALYRDRLLQPLLRDDAASLALVLAPAGVARRSCSPKPLAPPGPRPAGIATAWYRAEAGDDARPNSFGELGLVHPHDLGSGAQLADDPASEIGSLT
jgi:hypothetical protein